MYQPKSLLLTVVALASLVVFSMTPQASMAQHEPGKFYMGVRGGIGQSTLSGDDVSDASYRSAFTGGVYATYNVNEVFSIQMDVIYTERGADDVTAIGGPSESDALDLNEASVTTQYFQIPFLFKLTAPLPTESLRLRAFAGPSFDYLESAEINGDEKLPLQSNIPVENRLLFFDVSGIVGGELAVPLPVGADELAIDGRYHFGLADIEPSQFFTIRNQSFSGTISLRFDI